MTLCERFPFRFKRLKYENEGNVRVWCYHLPQDMKTLSLSWARANLYMEMQKRLRMEAVENTTSMAWYMSHSHTENSQWPSRRTLMALNTIAPIDTERSETNDWVERVAATKSLQWIDRRLIHLLIPTPETQESRKFVKLISNSWGKEQRSYITCECETDHEIIRLLSPESLSPEDAHDDQ